MPKLEATAAVTFRTTNVNDGLLCEFEKIIMELAAMIAKIIAQVKYTNIFLSYIRFSIARSHHFSDNLLKYKDFSMTNSFSPQEIQSAEPYFLGCFHIAVVVGLSWEDHT
jgi:hypothetical protein